MAAFRVHFLPSGRDALVEPGSTILAAARQAGELLAAPCGGSATCGNCLVRVTGGRARPAPGGQSGAGPPEEPGESAAQERIEAELWRRGFRLACRTRVESDLTVHVPAFSAAGAQVVLKTPRRRKFPLVDPVRQDGGLGLAVDLGTTTLAAYLCDMASGELVDWASAINPQLSMGEDVMTRVQRAVEQPEAAVRMRELAVATVQGLLEQLCARRAQATKGTTEGVSEVAVVGNSVMHHLFFGFDVSCLARAPFRPSTTGSILLQASTLGLDARPDTMLYSPPLIDGFVGSDNLAAILAADIAASGEATLLMDLGTNGELVLAPGNGTIFSTSCATGPAFEGSHITFGTRAVPGAVERVTINAATWEPRLGLVPPPRLQRADRRNRSARPVGLCGSGVIDALAQMLESGLITPDGRFTKTQHPRLRRGPQGVEYVLAHAGDSELGEDIVINAGDVRAVQLATGAIRAGTAALLRSAGCKSVGRVIVAGAFGARMGLDSAMRLGLIPHLAAQDVQFAGNLAGEGACLLLLDQACRRMAEDLNRMIVHVDLMRDPGFAADFVRSLRFPC